MEDHSSPSLSSGSPAAIAREALRRLAARRIAPTPDAYRRVYEEIAGTSDQPSAETTLGQFASLLLGGPEELRVLAHRLTQAVETRDWQGCSAGLRELCERLVTAPERGTRESAGELQALQPQPVPDLVQRLFPVNEAPQIRMLRDFLVRTLTLAVASLLQGVPELARESDEIAESIKSARTEKTLGEVGVRLKHFCFKIELKSGDMAEEHALLLKLFQLLLENVSELLEDDSWLSGQIAGVQELLSGPLSRHTLMDATRSLKEVIYKQGMLKHSLSEAKVNVKHMMLTFIDRLGAVAATTGDYHEKIDMYAQKISQATEITELNAILDDVMRETRHAQTEALRSRDAMLSARREVQNAEARIQELQEQLKHMSELVREDQLTGSLNRRGLDDVFEREAARSVRRRTPLCVALLDLDDFKRLNDTYGHHAGDEALIHVVRVIKDTLRTMDVIARFGGEEFLIVLPDTPLEHAVQTVTRLQRELTKRIFMHNNQRLLLTFSAGVALHRSGEQQTDLIQRADEALYRAKQAGKNRVVAAE